MNKLFVLLVAGTLALGLSGTAFAQGNAAKEITTAHKHALLSQNADSVAKAHMHLQHVVNCLAGPSGKAFDADAFNPCKGQGNGAIPDSANNQKVHSKLAGALATAKDGLKSDKLSAVHKAAAKVAATLKNTPAMADSGGYSW